jgi:steroid delta-isomerase-like uncharacterized protein
MTVDEMTGEMTGEMVDEATNLTEDQMMALVERHLEAEGAGDVEGAVSVYTDDVEHDPVGIPGGPFHGKDGARGFYTYLTQQFRTQDEVVLHRTVVGQQLCMESRMTGVVIGEMRGIPGHGRTITFRIFHVFGFRDGLICREQVWLDSGSIVAQLSAP